MQMLLPGAPTNCMTTIAEYSTSQKNNTSICNANVAIGTTATAATGAVVQFYGTFTSNTAGTAQVRWAQSVANATSTIIRANSYLVAYKITGADYAEIYYDENGDIQEGDIVQLSGNGASQVKKTSKSYQNEVIGIASTKP